MRFDQAVEAMREDIIKAARDMIRIRSIESVPEPGAPFGRELRQCLDKTLEICQEQGFSVESFDGYAGHAEYGEGEEIVGILVHVDVVPEGSGWTQDPYGGTVADGKLFGRGAIDDKGPAAAAIFALKAVKDAGVKFGRRVRIIVGCDEESGRWDCMSHYFKHAEMPTCGFSPDADFPIINSEMGILIFNLEKRFAAPAADCCGGLKVISMKGGSKVNMVPDYCECQLLMTKDFTERINKTIEYFNSIPGFNLKVEFEKDKCLIRSYGASAHGSTPEKGVNAVSRLLAVVSKLPLHTGEQAAYIHFLAEQIGLETDGTSFGLAMCDDVSGKLVFNLGIVEINEEKGTAAINIRYPVTRTRDDVYDIIKNKISEFGVQLKEGPEKNPLYVPADNFLVQKLQKVYEDATGEKAQLISIGGGTYARAIRNAVAFGPLFPGKAETAHQKDEYIEVEDLILCTKIFAEAICELVRVESDASK